MIVLLLCKVRYFKRIVFYKVVRMNHFYIIEQKEGLD